jgi:hypothetical protein
MLPSPSRGEGPGVRGSNSCLTDFDHKLSVVMDDNGKENPLQPPAIVPGGGTMRKEVCGAGYR